MKRRRFLQSLGFVFVPLLPALAAPTSIGMEAVDVVETPSWLDDYERSALEDAIWELYPTDCWVRPGWQQLPLFPAARHEWWLEVLR